MFLRYWTGHRKGVRHKIFGIPVPAFVLNILKFKLFYAVCVLCILICISSSLFFFCFFFYLCTGLTSAKRIQTYSYLSIIGNRIVRFYLRQGGYIFTLFVCLFVCLFVSRIVQKLLNQFSIKFGGKLAPRPPKNPLDFGGNPDHVALGLGSHRAHRLPLTFHITLCTGLCYG